MISIKMFNKFIEHYHVFSTYYMNIKFHETNPLFKKDVELEPALGNWELGSYKFSNQCRHHSVLISAAPT